jgi:hypothetical protein
VRWKEYLDQREMKYREASENCTMKGFIICFYSDQIKEDDMGETLACVHVQRAELTTNVEDAEMQPNTRKRTGNVDRGSV